MIKLSLLDESVREYEAPVTGADVAADIGPGLAKAALAVRINGEMMDLSRAIEADCDISIVTAKDEDALDLLRHDAAHVMAQAVQELFPGTQVTIGPSIENGYYYDFAREEPFSTDDFETIEKKMAEIVDRDLKFIREV
ncbi:MAG: TGS domain-containing protein, partial [Rhodospirillaceae bacterium]|nr:TGS domain-containing protein [Rhodospirillaceae bacterium]